MADQLAAEFQKLSTDERSTAAIEVATACKSGGVATLQSAAVAEKLIAAMADTASKEGALAAFKEIVDACGLTSEAYLLPVLPSIINLLGDKKAEVRDGANAALSTFLTMMCAFTTPMVLPHLFGGMEQSKNWQVKVGCLNALVTLSKTAPRAIGCGLSDIVPAVTDCMADAKVQVKTAASEAMTATFLVNGNRDIESFIPTLVSCIERPSEVAECIHKLAATTFVQSVESAPLAIIVPLLLRGLRERQTAIKRKAAVIVDNMAKLVENPLDAAPFLPKLMPELTKVSEEVADPDCRKVAAGALLTLQRIGEGRQMDINAVLVTSEDVQARYAVLLAGKEKAVDEVSFTHVCGLAAAMANMRSWEPDDWVAILPPYMEAAGKDAAIAATRTILGNLEEAYYKATSGDQQDEEGGEDLCNCEFSLAYGAKILLNMARMRLKKGKRYGLCGPNGAGKSTLMRAIANGQVEGFPPATELKTVYVEHDIDSEDADTPSADYVAQTPDLKLTTSREDVVTMLKSVGFSDEYLAKPVGTLSGGWKMKLALARAILQKAQILLLDEPTNHLDTTNVAWLINYLVTLKDVTCMVVSHDSGFLDKVCTSIVHYENRKLRFYLGNLSEFVKVKPEAKSYYELSATTIGFQFPEPGFLEGVKTKDKAILKMMKVGFKWPINTVNTLNDVSIYCTLSSRVVVLGANGAGKSTMIKILTGEMEPTTGTVWKHPNLRIAYVAQHAFFHLEEHLEKTANQYIQWRYATGEDRESLGKVDRKISDEERKKMEAVIVIDGVKRVVEKVCGRRKLKSSYEYEVQWLNCHPDENSWIPRDELEDMGFAKMIADCDAKEAAAAGLFAKPLTSANVSKHLELFGLENEFSTHSLLRGLSGGQKVKTVLGAAMWNNPHMLVLDEPTNYLDRDSLGALAQAIRDYGGGVIMITHHHEFSDALCGEKWLVADGKLTPTGQANPNALKEKVEFKQEEETTDAYGNVIKIKARKMKMTNKEKKAAEKIRKARKERGEVVTDSEEDA
eukprot:gene21666-28683_t